MMNRVIIMEKYLEVMRQSIELSNTIIVGYEQIQRFIEEGQFEEAILLYSDTINGIYSIENAVKPVLQELKIKEVPVLITAVVDSLDFIAYAFEERDYHKAQKALYVKLVPQYKQLKEKLEKAFNPYLVS